ncbi:MAG TPA: ribonuclease P protein component [Anaerolineales bacterium]|nr:ribonuclease P protein component [Anaerolineales bacterium]
MQRKFRLTRSEDFRRVRRSGKSYAHPLLVLVVTDGEPGRPRVGVAASRSVGSAVQRNRARRLLREAIRTMLPSLLDGRDLLLIARPPLPSCSVFQVREALVTLLRRAELLIPSDAA